MSTAIKRGEPRSRSVFALLGLTLWLTLGVHVVHPLFHLANDHHGDLCVDAGHDGDLLLAAAVADILRVDSAVPDAHVVAPCPVCVFIAGTGWWIMDCRPAYAQVVVPGSFPRPPGNVVAPAQMLLSQRSRAPPAASLLPA